MTIFSKITSVFIALMLTLFLFYVGANGYQTITIAKRNIFYVLCGGYSAVMMVLLAEFRLIGQIKLPSLKELLARSSWPQRFILLYLLFSFISAAISPYQSDTWLGASRAEGFLTILIYCLCFLFVSVFGRVERWMLWLLGGSVFLFCVLSIFQLYGANPFTLYPAGYNYFGANVDYSGAFLGTIGNIDLVGAFLCVVIPLLWIALLRLKGAVRFALVPSLLIALFVLAKMSVLASFVGVLGGAVLALPIVLPVSAKSKKVIGAAVLAIFAAVVALLFFVDIGTGFFHELHEVLHGRIDDSFGSGRIYIWKAVIEKIPEHLFFGTGPDTMSRAALEPFVRYDERLDMILRANIDTAHNEYLNVLFHQGLFALFTYLAALVSSAVKWIKRSGEDPVVAVLGGAVLCYCIQAFFGISMCATAPFFWICFGLLESHCNNTPRGRTKICGKR